MAKNSTSSKNKSGSGSKRKYQTRNTVKLSSLNNANSNSMHYLMELVSPNDCIVNQLETSTLFDKTQIETNHLYQLIKNLFRRYRFSQSTFR